MILSMAVKRVRAFCIWIWRGFNEIVVTVTRNIHFPAQDAQFLHQQFTNFAPGWDNICTWEWSKSIFLLESPHAAASKILCTGICTLFRAHWQLDVISVLLSPRLWSLRISRWFSTSSSLNPMTLHLGLSPLLGVQKWCPRGQVVIL